MSQFYVNASAVPGGSINTLSAQGGAPTAPAGNNFDFSGTASGAILFSIAANGLMRAAVQVDGTTIQINGSDKLTAVGGGGGITWNEVAGTSVSAVKANGYILGNIGTTTVSLPANGSTSVGDTFKIICLSGGFVINQAANQQIRFGDVATTVGASGTMTAAAGTFSTVTAVCVSNAGGTFLWTCDGGPLGNYTAA